MYWARGPFDVVIVTTQGLKTSQKLLNRTEGSALQMATTLSIGPALRDTNPGPPALQSSALPTSSSPTAVKIKSPHPLAIFLSSLFIFDLNCGPKKKSKMLISKEKSVETG